MREAMVDRSGAAKKRAASARKKGNDARASVLAFRAGDLDNAEADLAKLCTRLAKALAAGGGLAPDPATWIAALFPLARVAAAQEKLRFTAPARLFHDLTSACVIAEREIFVVDVLAWVRAGGKRPIVRALPATREVRIAKKVHAAVHKLATGATCRRAKIASASPTCCTTWPSAPTAACARCCAPRSSARSTRSSCARRTCPSTSPRRRSSTSCSITRSTSAG